ncbi:class I SAM-dependent methyltransferase [Pontixanthobacter sp. CEM42]|uniref:class I SAM-dependent methyltransferase n=1 Tax=Pontixanthobacter sp. CEM42 TaxID=2792077 RepID=UPI001ADFB178|nr:class I SAM-dependent methyltransferase [Pontixanthobacter sp. CEM42]
MDAKYDTIGVDYANLRKPDHRIQAAIEAALGTAKIVLNVGAGAGSYEPVGKEVTAVEPSSEMIAQRKPSNASVVRGVAEDLPFPDNSFDASMAVLTIHHWTDQATGLSEMRRVTRGPIVILTYDPAFRGFWLADYIPELVTLDEQQMPKLSLYQQELGPVDIQSMPIPHDCTDGFLCAYWRRPSAYLDPKVTAAMSSFWAIDNVSDALQSLKQDIADRTWQERYGHLQQLNECDLGYRLVVAR